MILPPMPGHRKQTSGEQQEIDAVGFSIGSKGYIGTGYNGSLYKDFWEYDPATNAWTQKADFGGTARCMQSDFPSAAKGISEPATMVLLLFKRISGNMILPLIPGHRKPISGEQQESVAVGFSIGSKGYIGTGDDGIEIS